MFIGTIFMDFGVVAYWAMVWNGVQFYSTEEYLAEMELTRTIPMTEHEVDWFIRL